MPTMQLEPRRVFAWQALAVACLGLGHLGATILLRDTPLFSHAEFRTLFDLDAETGFGAYFSSLAILACATAAFVLSQAEPTRPARRFWGCVAALAAFLALDEALGIHEHFSLIGKMLTSGEGIFRVNWWAGYVVALTPVGLAMAPGFFRLDPATRDRLMLAGVLFLIGAVGFEIIESARFDAFLVQRELVDGAHLDWARVAPVVMADAAYIREQSWLVLAEETLEMLGSALALRALLLRAANLGAIFGVTFVTPAPKSARAPRPVGDTGVAAH